MIMLISKITLDISRNFLLGHSLRCWTHWYSRLYEYEVESADDVLDPGVLLSVDSVGFYLIPNTFGRTIVMIRDSSSQISI